MRCMARATLRGSSRRRDHVAGDPFRRPFINPRGERLGRLIAPVEAVGGFMDHHRGEVLGILAGVAGDDHGAVFVRMFDPLAPAPVW